VHVAYPCNKHAGAPVSFILNLHGTMPSEELKLYQVAYFAANQHVSSHNLITVAPKSVVSQWGNSDGGVDEPHLMEVIDWVYSTFADFDIRSMWVGGHSWGSAYTASFGCKAELADKVDGLILMSGSGVGGFGGAACADRISAVVTTAEGDGRMPSDQAMLASSHGCGTGQMSTILNNQVTIWPDCTPHYVHANYYMLGKQHADYMDADVVESIVDLIKQARP
jgi:pimeloyl-ACP methyl ester carboxylesterase